MRMLASPTPLGAGTACAESFLSVLQRTATVHHVSLPVLLRFLRAMNSEAGASCPKEINLASATTGTGMQTRQLVCIHAKLSDSPPLNGHTLLPLAGVISPRANGIFIQHQRWCPVCLDPDNERYGMLAWLLRPIAHCPLHGVLLEEFCGNCYRSQSNGAMLITHPYCVRCGSPLWKRRRWSHAQKRYDDWVESQMFDLIGYLSDPERPRPQSNWFETYELLLRRLGNEAIGRFRGVGAEQSKLLRRLPQFGLHVNTLLWLAANHSTNLIDVVLRPNEVLAEVFPNLEAIPRVVPIRSRYAQSQLSLCQRISTALIQSRGDVYLPSQATLAALLRLPVWCGRDVKLARRYSQARARNGDPTMGRTSAAYDRLFVLELLRLGELESRNDFLVARILARNPIDAPSEVSDRIEKAAKLVHHALGRVVKLSTEELGLESSQIIKSMMA